MEQCESEVSNSRGLGPEKVPIFIEEPVEERKEQEIQSQASQDLGMNMNSQEVQDFFGMDYQELQKIMSESKEEPIESSNKLQSLLQVKESQIKNRKVSDTETVDITPEKYGKSIAPQLNGKGYSVNLNQQNNQSTPSGSVKNPFGIPREQSQSSLYTRYTTSVRGSNLSARRIKMRISDIFFREVEAQDIEWLLSNDYRPQTYKDPRTGESFEIDLSDWSESLTRLCLNPNTSLWLQDPSHPPPQGSSNSRVRESPMQFAEEEEKESPLPQQKPQIMVTSSSLCQQKRGNLAANKAQFIEYVKKRKIVGVACFYKQALSGGGGLEEDGQGLLEGHPPLREGHMIGQTREAEKDLYNGYTSQAFPQSASGTRNIMIGMVLLHLHKPRNDSSFPDELKGLPIFQGKVKLKKDLNQGPSQNQQPRLQQAQPEIQEAPQPIGIEIKEEEEDYQGPYKGVSHFFVDDSTQVGNILLMAVVPQCRRSGIGTLLHKKALFIVEQQFRDCVLIYGQRNDQIQPQTSPGAWKSLARFLAKNHFKMILKGEQIEQEGTQQDARFSNASAHSQVPTTKNSIGGSSTAKLSSSSRSASSQLPGECAPPEHSILYYPIAALVRRKDQQRSTRGLINEVFRAFCRNPFAQCSREGRTRFKKELQQLKKKYEKDDIILDVEKFACDDEESSDEEEEAQQIASYRNAGPEERGRPLTDQQDLP